MHEDTYIYQNQKTTILNYSNTESRETSKGYCPASCYGNRNSEGMTVGMDSLSIQMFLCSSNSMLSPIHHPITSKLPTASGKIQYSSAF